MTLWWLQPGWTDATCGCCGATIYPEGDPDWGLCWPCMQYQTEQAEMERQELEAAGEVEKLREMGAACYCRP